MLVKLLLSISLLVAVVHYIVPLNFLAMSSMSQLVALVKEKLEKEHNNLPLGKNGRDDEEMILRFLKDQKYSVEKAVYKLNKAIKWRHDIGVSQLSEESIKNVADTGEVYLHDYLDVYNRPVLIVEAAKHKSGRNKQFDNEKLFAFLIEKALKKLPDGKEHIILVMDLQGAGIKNVDMKFVPFLYDVLCYYYPGRFAEILVVNAPVILKPLWQIIKPMLTPYSSLVKFCSAKNVREEHFTADTVPTI